MECCIKKLDEDTRSLFPHPHQPFDIIGRLIPIYNGESWTYREILRSENKQKVYKDESLDPDDYIGSKKRAVFLAFCGGICIGSVCVSAGWLNKGFIEDLTVDKEHRRSGVGKKLMDSAVSWCREQGQGAVSLETQNNNLQACRFYIKYGFELCGINTKKYALSEYKDEVALYFFMKL